MARNRFDIDETLETPFSFEHLKRAGVYIKKHKKKIQQNNMGKIYKGNH